MLAYKVEWNVKATRVGHRKKKPLRWRAGYKHFQIKHGRILKPA